MIQVAGVRGQSDLDVLMSAGVDYIGFPLRLGYHAEDISEAEAKTLIESLSTEFTPVLITYLQEASAVIRLADFLGVKLVQIHSEISKHELSKIKTSSPIKVIKSLVVRSDNLEGLKSTLEHLSPLVDYFITDTFDPETGAEGATGKTHDWDISRELVELSSKPVILAGGLKPTNVEEAIVKVRPAGVDSHTGVEDEKGFKDFEKTKAFVDLARKALQQVRS